MSQPPKTRLPKLPSAWGFIRQSLSDFRAHWTTYVFIVAIVAIPANLLGLIGTLSEDTSFNAYSTMAALFMNVALLTAMVHFANGAKRIRFSDAYYDGSASVLRFILVSTALSVMTLPLMIGVLVYLIGSYPTAGTTPSLAEHAILGGVALLLAVPSFWLLTRFLLALPATVADGQRPMAALRRARHLTLRRFWPMLGRLLALIIITAAVSLLLYTPFVGLGLLLPNQATFFFAVYQVILALLVLPFINLYLLKLYRTLAEATV